MSEPKDTTSFFRKVVKFVANPTTEWAELGAPPEEQRETEFAKSELKAMIERKRRNDFVRKREFDVLRRVRREGLSSEQLAALGGSSRLDDSEAKLLPDSAVKADVGVKEKIDRIEQQMVGDTFAGSQRRSPEFYNAPTQPVPLEAPGAGSGSPDGGGRVDGFAPTAAGGMHPPAVMGPGMTPLKLESSSMEFGQAFAVETSEGAHDPELDEAVIAFANADFDQCEQAISALTAPGAARADHAETWLVLFDLYRAVGQQQKFETLALDYAQQFGWSAPQWFSMPRLVAEAASDDAPSSPRLEGNVGWVCPEYIDADSVGRLASQSLQMPLPWVFDWSSLRGIDPEGCARLSELFRNWIGQKLDMRWIGGETLFAVLADAAPTGVRDCDPAYWQLRLDALRMTNRPDQFDEAAIDYCVTYEVSPPSWERATCQVRVSGSSPGSTTSPTSLISEVSTSFLESQTTEDENQVLSGHVDLSGQLVGDISALLKRMDHELGDASVISVSCARLIRVDFIAAGDLLNWVLVKRNENRSVAFTDSHRLVALFFGAMGINEHAKISVRQV